MRPESRNDARRFLALFACAAALLPMTLLGGWMQMVVVPALACAVLALRQALRFRARARSAGDT